MKAQGWTYHKAKPVEHKFNSLEMEVALSKFFNPRQNIIVPNISWGMGGHHECDLMVLTQCNFAYEVEIKVSAADLKADAKKTHAHPAQENKETKK